MPTKVDANELNSLLSQKANLNDIKKTMGEVAQNLEDKTTTADVRKMIDQKVDKKVVTINLWDFAEIDKTEGTDSRQHVLNASK